MILYSKIPSSVPSRGGAQTLLFRSHYYVIFYYAYIITADHLFCKPFWLKSFKIFSTSFVQYYNLSTFVNFNNSDLFLTISVFRITFVNFNISATMRLSSLLYVTFVNINISWSLTCRPQIRSIAFHFC